MNDPLCRQRTCTKSQYNPRTGLNFCCCFGSYCNTNFHKAVKQVVTKYQSVSNSRNKPTPSKKYRVSSNPLASILAVGSILCIFIVGFVITLVIFGTRCARLHFGRLIGFHDKHCISNLKNRFVSASTDSCRTASTRLLSSRSRQGLLQVSFPHTF